MTLFLLAAIGTYILLSNARDVPGSTGTSYVAVRAFRRWCHSIVFGALLTLLAVGSAIVLSYDLFRVDDLWGIAHSLKNSSALQQILLGILAGWIADNWIDTRNKALSNPEAIPGTGTANGETTASNLLWDPILLSLIAVVALGLGIVNKVPTPWGEIQAPIPNLKHAETQLQFQVNDESIRAKIRLSFISGLTKRIGNDIEYMMLTRGTDMQDPQTDPQIQNAVSALMFFDAYVDPLAGCIEDLYQANRLGAQHVIHGFGPMTARLSMLLARSPGTRNEAGENPANTPTMSDEQLLQLQHQYHIGARHILSVSGNLIKRESPHCQELLKLIPHPLPDGTPVQPQNKNFASWARKAADTSYFRLLESVSLWQQGNVVGAASRLHTHFQRIRQTHEIDNINYALFFNQIATFGPYLEEDTVTPSRWLLSLVEKSRDRLKQVDCGRYSWRVERLLIPPALKAINVEGDRTYVEPGCQATLKRSQLRLTRLENIASNALAYVLARLNKEPKEAWRLASRAVDIGKKLDGEADVGDLDTRAYVRMAFAARKRPIEDDDVRSQLEISRKEFSEVLEEILRIQPPDERRESWHQIQKLVAGHLAQAEQLLSSMK